MHQSHGSEVDPFAASASWMDGREGTHEKRRRKRNVAGILEADGHKAPEGVAALDDGFVVKNRLPALVAVEFKTESQWRMLGFSLADGASAVPMHPTGFLGGKTCDYYHASDVEAMDASPEFASAFARRQENLATLISASPTGHGGLKANFPWCDGF